MNNKPIVINSADLFCIQSALYTQIRTARKQLELIEKEYPKSENPEMYKMIDFVADESEKVLKKIGGSIEALDDEMTKTFFSHFTDNN